MLGSLAIRAASRDDTQDTSFENGKREHDVVEKETNQ